MSAGAVSPEKESEIAAAAESAWNAPAQVVLAACGGEEEAAEVVAKHMGLELAGDLDGVEAPDVFFDKVAPGYARHMGVVAMGISESVVELAAAPGEDLAVVLAEMSCLFGREIRCRIATRRAVESVIDRGVRERPEYLADAAGELGQDTAGVEDAPPLEHVTDFGELMRRTPVVKMVSLLIAQAVRTGSSDIHFQPLGDRLGIRFRVDGMLHDVIDLPRSAQDAVLSRVKVLGKMDIAERRAPQDGRASFKYADRDIDVRISVVPTTHGERVVLRLFDKQTKLLALDQLGLGPANLEQFDRLIRNTSGMILVTGPTGSGKNTTLYAALRRINSPELNIITIEDPVEYKLPGISQIQVLAEKNVTFGSMLRSVLRQDPDILMIGEIRDAETAAIAVQSALTGHLVFSTLHTNDSAGAIARLLDLRVEPFLISSGLLGVLAQRLVRRVCKECAVPSAPSEGERGLLGIAPDDDVSAALGRGPGCESCLGSGYLGRMGIFELLPVNDALRDLINKRASSAQIREAALRDGLVTLRSDGTAKVLSGVTTAEEVLRVTQGDAS